jgi:hypothetical protein
VIQSQAHRLPQRGGRKRSNVHIAIWILVFLGWAVWSLLAWGLHAVLTIDPKWIDDVEALIANVPYAEVIERWVPGWQELLRAAMDLTQTVLGWFGNNAPLVAWIVWGIGTLALLATGGVLSLIVCLLTEKKKTPTGPAAA